MEGIIYELLTHRSFKKIEEKSRKKRREHFGFEGEKRRKKRRKILGANPLIQKFISIEITTKFKSLYKLV